MDRYYQPSGIRIFDSNHRPVGTGIYVGEHLILTCEHVVARAQGRSRAQQEGLIPLDFAYDGRPPGAPKPSARVPKLQPDSAVRRFGQLYDVAVLQVIVPETIPFFAAAAPLSVIPDVTNQKGNVFGFANDAGRSVAIRCGLQLTGTLVELFFDKNQAPVAGGHSGSPVWNAVQQVIGMLIEGDEDSGDDISPKAYMLPAAQFEFALSGFRSEVSQKVQKCKPKKIPQTDAIFEQVHRTNSEADDSETTLRISLDTKATVKLGEFSRGGKSRQPQQAADHDFEPDTSLTPFGILQPDTGESHIWFSGGKVTADLMADCLEEMLPKWQAKQTVTELVINADNGPESTGHRTQWLNRLVEMADDHQITIKLAYYPPYHSTYNPVERLWGILENHWRGELLDSVQKTLGLARSMTFKGIRPKLKKIRRVYKSGITVAKKAMREIEARLERKEGLESWFIGKDR